MTYNSVRLNVFPPFAAVKRFLDDIVPQLTDCGLCVVCELDRLLETEDGCAEVVIEVYDLNEKVFAVEHGAMSYSEMANLANVLELKQVELQLDALLPRMAAVGWRLHNDSEDESAFCTDDASADQKLILTRSDGSQQDFVPCYAHLNQLRQELIRTEATFYVQSHWLQLEAAKCEVTLGTETILTRQKGTTKMHGYTLEEAKSLVRNATTPSATDLIV